MFVSLWDLTGTSAACQISEWSDNFKYKSRGFETLRDLTIRRLIGYWNRAQGVSGHRADYTLVFPTVLLYHWLNSSLHCHYIYQWWPGFMMSNCITRLQWALNTLNMQVCLFNIAVGCLVLHSHVSPHGLDIELKSLWSKTAKTSQMTYWIIFVG